ncbi:MAG: CvpA family protein [Thermaerobacter sp.]|nr:CvpA family protein [Thermaerobacter sp.]
MWVDVIVGVYLFLGVVSGHRRGLVLVVFSLAGYIVGIMAALRYQVPMTSLLLTQLPINTWIHHLLPAPALASPGATKAAFRLGRVLLGLVVFLLIVGTVEFFGRVLGQWVTHAVLSAPLTGMLNRVGGGVAGLAEHGVIAGLILTVVLGLPMLPHTGLYLQIVHAPLAAALIGWFGHLGRLPGGAYL